MNKLLTKIKSNKGETLVETLVAMMIMSLVSALLFVMINGAFRLNSQAAESDGKFYVGLSEVENKTANSGETTMEINYGINGSLNGTYNVQVDVYTSNGISSYVKVVP